MNKQINKLFLIVGGHIAAIFIVNNAFRLVEQQLDIIQILIVGFAMFAFTIGTSWSSWRLICQYTGFGNTSIATWVPCAVVIVATHYMLRTFEIRHIVLDALTVVGIIFSIYQAKPVDIPSRG